MNGICSGCWHPTCRFLCDRSGLAAPKAARGARPRNEHVHFHVCVVDGVFEVVPGEGDAQASPPSVIFGAPKLCFHPASGIDEATVAQARADLRRRILRAFVGRGLLESFEAKEMLAYPHSGSWLRRNLSTS